MTTSIVNTMNSSQPVSVKMGNNVINVVDWNAATVLTDFGEFPASRVDGFRIGRDTEKYITRNADIEFAYKWVFITRYPIEVLRSGLVSVDKLRTRWRRLAKNGYTKLKSLVTESYKLFYETVNAKKLITTAKNIFSMNTPTDQVVSGNSRTVRRREQRKRNRVKIKVDPGVVSQASPKIKAGKVSRVSFEAERATAISSGGCLLEDDLDDYATRFHHENWSDNHRNITAVDSSDDLNGHILQSSSQDLDVDDLAHHVAEGGTVSSYLRMKNSESCHVPSIYQQNVFDSVDMQDAPPSSDEDLSDFDDAKFARHVAEGGKSDSYLIKHMAARYKPVSIERDEIEEVSNNYFHGIPPALYNHRLQVNALHDIPYIKMASQMLVKVGLTRYYGSDKVYNPADVLYKFICEALDYEYKRDDLSAYYNFVKKHMLIPSKETMYIVDHMLFKRLCKISGLSWCDDIDTSDEKDMELIMRSKSGKSEEIIMKTKVDSSSQPHIQEKVRGLTASVGLDTKPDAVTLKVNSNKANSNSITDTFWRIWNDE